MDTDSVSIHERIQQQMLVHPILLYMKGTPEQPRCGFSARVVQILDLCGVKFAHVDVLENPDIRRALPGYSNWPTFPQLFHQGELLGGCDIVEELYRAGVLLSKLSKT